MSYILDALRKAERERGIAQVPNLMTVHETVTAKPQKRIWLISAVLLVCVAALFLVVFSIYKSSAPSTIQQVNREVKAEAAAQPSAVESTQSPAKPAVQAANPEREPPRKPNVTSSTPTSVQTTDSTAIRNAATQESRPRSESTPPQIKSSTQPPINPGAPVPVATQSAPAPDNSAPAEISLREAMAKMKISILMYDEAKSGRMVFINNRKYLEGDYVDGRYLIESISLEGAVLSYKGERALLRASPN